MKQLLYCLSTHHNRPSPFGNFRKNFRNLRTIIVIADVHRRFGNWREPLPLTFRHWSGVTPYTSPCGFAESCVFDKQSVEKLSLRPMPRNGSSNHQITISKQNTNHNFQSPNFLIGVWILNFGFWNLFGLWNLGFGISSA